MDGAWICRHGHPLVCTKLFQAWDGAGSEKRRGGLEAEELGASPPFASRSL